MAKLLLYLKGDLFTEMDIDLPEYKNTAFKTKVTLRKWFIDSKIAEMKALYYKQISKLCYEYHFVLMIESDLEN